jgi:hypothetical protein
MVPSSESLLGKQRVRLLLMVIVTMLLNFGLFFILNFLAPLVSGLVVGYLVAKHTDAIIVTCIGTALSYFAVFLLTDWILGFTYALSDVAVAIIIMVGIGVLGGLIGSILGTKRFAAT